MTKRENRAGKRGHKESMFNPVDGIDGYNRSSAMRERSYEREVANSDKKPPTHEEQYARRLAAMKARTPSMTPILAVAIDQWLDMGGENDPNLGILFGDIDDHYMYPWTLYPRTWPAITATGYPSPTSTVKVRGPLDATTYQVVRCEHFIATTLRVTSASLLFVGLENFLAFSVLANGVGVRTWLTGQGQPRLKGSDIHKLIRRIERGIFGAVIPELCQHRQTNTDRIIHPRDWPT